MVLSGQLSATRGRSISLLLKNSLKVPPASHPKQSAHSGIHRLLSVCCARWLKRTSRRLLIRFYATKGKT
jgi:hypothetical protein